MFGVSKSLYYTFLKLISLPDCVLQNSPLSIAQGLTDGGRHQLVGWLALCSGWVFTLVVLGGVTRLTRSGLSMTEWSFTGAIHASDVCWNVFTLPWQLGQPEICCYCKLVIVSCISHCLISTVKYWQLFCHIVFSIVSIVNCYLLFLCLLGRGILKMLDSILKRESLVCCYLSRIHVHMSGVHTHNLILGWRTSCIQSFCFNIKLVLLDTLSLHILLLAVQIPKKWGDLTDVLVKTTNTTSQLSPCRCPLNHRVYISPHHLLLSKGQEPLHLL